MKLRRLTARCLPVLPTERIAHLGTADCCIHPTGRNEMIAITPPNIFSKEVAHKQATPLTAPATPLTTRNRFTPNFRGWRLDENLKPKSPPTRGAHIDVRWQDKNEVGLAGSRRRLMPRTRPAPPSCNRDALHAAAPPPFTTVQKMRIT